MKKQFKPKEYNSLSPYFIVNGAQKMIDLLKEIFDAKELRKYSLPDGTIMHAEALIDDTVIMVADSSDQFPPNNILVHVYVSDVDKIYEKALAAGCESVEPPREREGDPDRRGSFKDFSGNVWSIGTQMKEEL